MKLFTCPHCGATIPPIGILVMGVRVAPAWCEACRGEVQMTFTPPISVRTYRRLDLIDNLLLLGSGIPVIWWRWGEPWWDITLWSALVAVVLVVINLRIKVWYLRRHAHFAKFVE
jgi:hypothetical protein